MSEPRLIGCAGQSIFRGCRVGHELVRNHVIIEIHGGSKASRPSADEPAQFMMSLTGLDELIDELRNIREEVARAELAWANRIGIAA